MAIVDTSKLHELTPDEFGAAFDQFNQEWQRIQDLLQKLRSGGRVETRGRKKGSSTIHDLNTKAGQVAAAGELDDIIEASLEAEYRESEVAE